MNFSSQLIDFKISKSLNQLVADYVNQNEKVSPFYNQFPDARGFSELINNNLTALVDRDTLVNELTYQNQLVANTSSLTDANTQLLLNKNCFTVTTGHQLCLFTGPLYFIYKIFSSINLALELKQQFPQHNFVSVYWMASEDHDFEEINNFSVFGKNTKWESEQTGAVGNFETNELEQIIPQLQQLFGDTENGIYLFTLFKNAYIEHKNLKNATRFLVNQLFGNYGLIILDGDSGNLKKQFINHFKTDIFNNTPYLKVSESIAKLETLGYKIQVNPRLINCFFMENGLRARIEKQEDYYVVVGTDKKFTKQELENLIETNPEKFSPNVVLRPLYQQHILPNIAYVGGPGELAYWLQYKAMFTEFTINFPILVPRSFITVIDKTTRLKLEKLNFSEVDIFKDEQELIKEFQQKANAIFSLESEKKTIEQLYEEIQNKITAVDKTLVASVNAELQKNLSGLDALTAKANKALKQKLDTEISQIKTSKQKLFPNNLPQERVDNFAAFYLKYGTDFFDELKKITNPLNLKHTILSEV